MATATIPRPQAFYAELYGEPIVLAKLNGAITIVTPRGEPILLYTPALDADLTVLGAMDMSDYQRLTDLANGGYARIACERQMEVQ